MADWLLDEFSQQSSNLVFQNLFASCIQAAKAPRTERASKDYSAKLLTEIPQLYGS